MSRKVSDSTVRRISHYLRILERFEAHGSETVSSADLAQPAGTTAAQVRKDLSLFGSFGKRGLGYGVRGLSEHLQEILGLAREWRVALVGAGRIGAALFAYADFRRRGFRIVAVLDNDPAKIGAQWGPLRVQDADELEGLVSTETVDLVILAVPAEAAQAVATRAVAAGAKGILNFAPTQLHVPANIAVQEVNVVMELEALSFEITHPAKRAR